MVTIEEITALKERFKVLELERAKLSERKRKAEEDRQKAEEELYEHGLEPDTASQRLSEMYRDIEEQITQMEVLLGLT